MFVSALCFIILHTHTLSFSTVQWLSQHKILLLWEYRMQTDEQFEHNFVHNVPVNENPLSNSALADGIIITNTHEFLFRYPLNDQKY